jgi:aminopeptidase C
MQEGVHEIEMVWILKMEIGSLGTNTGKDTYLIMNDFHWVYYVFQITLMINQVVHLVSPIFHLFNILDSPVSS